MVALYLKLSMDSLQNDDIASEQFRFCCAISKVFEPLMQSYEQHMEEEHLYKYGIFLLVQSNRKLLPVTNNDKEELDFHAKVNVPAGKNIRGKTLPSSTPPEHRGQPPPRIYC